MIDFDRDMMNGSRITTAIAVFKIYLKTYLF